MQQPLWQNWTSDISHIHKKIKNSRLWEQHFSLRGPRLPSVRWRRFFLYLRLRLLLLLSQTDKIKHVNERIYRRLHEQASKPPFFTLQMIVIVELRQGLLLFTRLDDSAILPYFFPRIGRLLTKLRIGLSPYCLTRTTYHLLFESTSLIALKESVFDDRAWGRSVHH